jgi:O-antigen ligase
MRTLSISALGGQRSQVAFGIFFALAVTIAASWLNNPLLFFLPAALLALPVLGLRILVRPVLVLSIYMLLAVNLDFFRIGETDVSLHVVFSSLLLWALVLRLGMSRRPLFRTTLERIFLVFLLVTLVSVVLSVNPGRSFKNWFRDVEYIVLYAFITGLVLQVEDRRTLAWAIICSSIIPSVSAIVGILLDIPQLYGLETPVAGGEVIRRVYGTLRHPVSLSIYLAITSTLTLSFLINGRWFRKTYLLALLLLQWVVLYLTFGRTGWIVMLVAAVVLLAISGKRRWIFLGIPPILGAVAVMLPTFIARWETAWSMEGENSFLWRVGLWAYALGLVPARPLFGSGPDTFTEYVAYDSKASHQTWVGLAIETGLVGAVCFLAFVIAVTVMLRRRLRRAEWNSDPIARATIAVFWGILAGSLAENPFEVPVIATLVWVLLALTLSERMASGHPDRYARA